MLHASSLITIKQNKPLLIRMSSPEEMFSGLHLTSTIPISFVSNTRNNSNVDRPLEYLSSSQKCVENVHDFSGENKCFWNPQVWRHLKEEYFLLVEWNKRHLALVEVDRSGAAAVADQLELLCSGKPSPPTPHIKIV